MAVPATDEWGDDFVPELPEVESARTVIERAGLNRPIVDVNDTDTYVARPHPPGEMRAALVGRRLTAVHRRGKSIWCETSGTGPSRSPGPMLGIHLGMSGKIVIADPRGRRSMGATTGSVAGARVTTDGVFALTFADGGSLMLIDPRRLGRVRLEPAGTPRAGRIVDHADRVPLGDRSRYGAGQGAPARPREDRRNR